MTYNDSEFGFKRGQFISLQPEINKVTTTIKRLAIVLAMALPGAFFGGVYGALIAAFSGDASPSRFGSLGWFVWGIAGGACMGALPGLFLGLYFRMRWVIPFVVAGVGGLYGLAEASGLDLAANVWQQFGGSKNARGINIAGMTSGLAVVVGFLIGLVWCAALICQDRQHDGADLRPTGHDLTALN